MLNENETIVQIYHTKGKEKTDHEGLHFLLFQINGADVGSLTMTTAEFWAFKSGCMNGFVGSPNHSFIEKEGE